MRAVLDTNVFFSALISPHGAPNEIYRAWRAAKFEIVTSRQQLDELKMASRYPKFRAVLQPHKVGQMINNLQRGFVVEQLPPGPDTADPHDACLLTMAIVADADYLVTGDHRAGILELGQIGRTRIITPRTFCSTAL